MKLVSWYPRRAVLLSRANKQRNSGHQGWGSSYRFSVMNVSRWPRRSLQMSAADIWSGDPRIGWGT